MRLSLPRLAVVALAALPLALLPLAAGPALAQGNSGKAGKPAQAGKPDHAGKPDAPGRGGSRNDGEITGEEVLLGVLTAAEKALIRDWYGSHGPVKVSALPPGIQMKVARGGALPPGIAKKQLPHGLLAQLPRRPGQDYARIGRDVVLVEKATGIVIDILKDAL